MYNFGKKLHARTLCSYVEFVMLNQSLKFVNKCSKRHFVLNNYGRPLVLLLFNKLFNLYLLQI